MIHEHGEGTWTELVRGVGGKGVVINYREGVWGGAKKTGGGAIEVLPIQTSFSHPEGRGEGGGCTNSFGTVLGA